MFTKLSSTRMSPFCFIENKLQISVVVYFQIWALTLTIFKPLRTFAACLHRLALEHAYTFFRQSLFPNTHVTSNNRHFNFHSSSLHLTHSSLIKSSINLFIHYSSTILRLIQSFIHLLYAINSFFLPSVFHNNILSSVHLIDNPEHGMITMVNGVIHTHSIQHYIHSSYYQSFIHRFSAIDWTHRLP